MLRNRLILLFLILGAGTFCSFYGGVSYLLLFTVLILPLVSLAYLVYVMISFRITQKLDETVLHKGDETVYRFTITNELPLTYSGIEPLFQKELVEAEHAEMKRYTILPGESVNEEERIRFLYRGSYNVGVHSVLITDYLNLFKIRHKIPHNPKVQVLPRIIPISRFAAVPLDEDSKTLPFSSLRMQDQPDIESRPYVPGDELRIVNWKLSAREQELLVRKFVDIPKSHVFLITDFSPTGLSDPLKKLAAEDQIIEVALSAADYFVRKQVPLDVLYGETTGTVSRIKLRSRPAFESFYRVCADVAFHSVVGLSSVLEEAAIGCNSNCFFVAVTHKLDDAFHQAANRILTTEAGLCVILISDDAEEKPELDKRVRFLHLTPGQAIAEVLEQQEGRL